MNNPKRTVAATVAFILAVVGIIAAFGLSGCTERGQVSYNLSQDADNFNVRRRVTVINMRSDKVLLQMEGCLSIKTDPDTNELNVIAELPNGEYQKHFIYLNDWTMCSILVAVPDFELLCAADDDDLTGVHIAAAERSAPESWCHVASKVECPASCRALRSTSPCL